MWNLDQSYLDYVDLIFHNESKYDNISLKVIKQELSRNKNEIQLLAYIDSSLIYDPNISPTTKYIPSPNKHQNYSFYLFIPWYPNQKVTVLMSNFLIKWPQ